MPQMRRRLNELARDTGDFYALVDTQQPHYPPRARGTRAGLGDFSMS
jgi:hypothetical protein